MDCFPLPAAESLTPNEFLYLLEHLRAIIRDLPSELPVGDPATSKYSTFLSFQLDMDLVERTGSDIGAFNEQFKRVFGWKARTTGNQLLSIDERGNPILAVVDVLEQYHLRDPEDNIIKKWAVDITAGMYNVYGQYGRTPAAWSAAKEGHQITLDVAFSGSTSTVATTQSTQTTNGSKGRPQKPLMNKLIIKLEEEKSWRCAAPRCDHVRKGSPQEDRVLKHASTCPFLDPCLKREAIEASKNTSLGGQARAAASIVSVEPSSQTSGEPPAKRSKQMPSKIDLTPFCQAGKRKKQADNENFQRDVNLLILKLICVRGLVPAVLDSPEWKEFVNTLNSMRVQVHF